MDDLARNTSTASQAPDAAVNPILDLALDDLDGLLEAARAIGDERRSGKLVRNRSVSKTIRRELAAGADAYVASLISSARGELDRKRIAHCRKAALDAMPTATARRKELAAVVNERREDAPEIRDDVKQLVNLSLHFRGALGALAPTVDKRAAESIGNRVLVDLRHATLQYLATSRLGGGTSTEKPRAAVAAQIEKTEAEVRSLAALAPESTGGLADTLGVSLSSDVAQELHHTHIGWAPASEAHA